MVFNKPAAQAEGADRSKCNRKKTILSITPPYIFTNYSVWISFNISNVPNLYKIVNLMTLRCGGAKKSGEEKGHFIRPSPREASITGLEKKKLCLLSVV